MSIYSFQENAPAATVPHGATDIVPVTQGGVLKQSTMGGVYNFSQSLANFRNLLDGGDFTVNPFQRGTSQAADITNSATYGPDRWFFFGGASSALDWSSVADTTVPGFATSLKFQRKSGNADTTALNMAQILETADTVRTQGQFLCFSFYAASGANYSGGALTVKIVTGTGTNEGASSLVSGSWTSQANLLSATQAITSTMTRYQFVTTAAVGATITEAAVQITWTPSGTAGTNDYVQLNGLQLEIVPSNATVASPFEHRDIQVELEICQRYCWVINEPAAAVVVGTGSMNSTTAAIIYMATPVQMRTAPTLTVTAGTFHCAPAGATASGTAAAGTTHTANAITITVSGITASTAGFGTPLVGAGGSGKIVASADL